MKHDLFDIVSINDWHYPFHDKNALKLAFKFCQKVQPPIIIIHEAHDFYKVSSFNKDPERKESLQDELDGVAELFKELRRICPKSLIYLLHSNHLDRLKNYLWRQAPELACLRDLRIENLLRLKESSIILKPDFTFRDFLFKHGSIVRKDSGMSARAELAKEGVSGVSGHTHRLSQVYKTLRGGKFTWIESGCLCRTDMEYIEGTADWQQGISIVSFVGNTKRFFATTIPIIDNSILYGNEFITL